MLELVPDALVTLVAGVAQALSEPPGAFFVSAGSPAWDDCCTGRLWVRVVRVDSNSSAGANCGTHSWTLTLAVGIIRCAAVPGNDGSAPRPGDLTRDSLGQLRDMLEIQKWLCREVEGIRFSSWSPLDAQGGCVGGEWEFTLRVAA